jgi:hypothetical protein
MSVRSAPYSNSQPSQQLINMGWKERDFVKKKERKSLCKPKKSFPEFSSFVVYLSGHHPV